MGSEFHPPTPNPPRPHLHSVVKRIIFLDTNPRKLHQIDMHISIKIEKTNDQCTQRVITLDIPGIGTDLWLCIEIITRLLFWKKSIKWAIHLI